MKRALRNVAPVSAWLSCYVAEVISPTWRMITGENIPTSIEPVGPDTAFEQVCHPPRSASQLISSNETSGPPWADSPRLASQVKLIGAKVNAARLPRTIPLAPAPQSRLRYAEFRPAYRGRRLHEGGARRTSTSIPTNLWAGTVRFAVTCNLAPHSR